MVDSIGGSGWLELDRPPAVPTTVDLPALLSSVLGRRAVLGAPAYAADLPPDPPALFVDEVRLRAVLGALLSNAARFSAPDGVVRVTAQARPEDVLVTVADTGGGIAESELDAVCQFGYRGTNNPPGWAGLGLGLYAAKSLVEAWGGTLSVTSRVGQGTAVSLTCPART
jgi:two-component system sensor histidine kinase KdpD